MKLDDASPSDVLSALELVRDLAQGFREIRPDHEPWLAPALGWLDLMQDLTRQDVH